MKISAPRTALVLALAFVAMSLSFARAGTPMSLRADEGLLLGTAASLGIDGDLTVEREDLRRIFNTAPRTEPIRLRLAFPSSGNQTSSGEKSTLQSLRWAPRDLLYAAIAALPVRLAGRSGAFALNAACLLAAIALWAAALWRRTGSRLSLPFVAGFFLWSALTPSVFRVQALGWNTFLIAIALALPLRGAGGALTAGFAFGAVCWTSPWLAPLALVRFPSLAGSPRRAGIWFVGLLVALGALFAVSRVPDGSTVKWVRVEHPLVAGQAGPIDADSLRDLGRIGPEERGLPRGLHVLSGAHAGWFPYFPLTGIALLLWLLPPNGRPRSRLPIAALGLTLGALYLFGSAAPPPPGPWDSLGDPRFVVLGPAFLLLVSSLRTRWLLPATWAFGAFLTGPMLLTSLGSPVPELPVHGHLGNGPWPSLPVELELLPRLPHWDSESHPEGRVWFPKERFRWGADSLITERAGPAEIWFESPISPENLQVEVEGDLPEGGTLLVGQRRRSLEAGDLSRRIQVQKVRPKKHFADADWIRIRLAAKRPGHKPIRLRVLGTWEFLDRDIYALEWLGCGAPPALEVGDEGLAMARLRNLSLYPWTNEGPARVRLSYRWLTPEGEPLQGPTPLRTELDHPIAPGAELSSWVKVKAPRKAGSYLLELDPVFESVSWFSEKNEGITCRSAVSVRPSTAP